MSLPLRLMVVMVVLCLALPVVADAVGRSQEQMAASEMERESGRLADAVAAVHYSGAGSARTVELSVPAGCEIAVGGRDADAYSIRCYLDGELLCTRHFEKPPVMVQDEERITSDGTYLVESVYFGESPGARVTRL